jgi:hypothetical protein
MHRGQVSVTGRAIPVFWRVHSFETACSWEEVAMWPIVLVVAVSTAALTAIYGVYHLIVGIRKHGWLYTRNRPSRTSALGSFVAIQQMIEPQVQHVIKVKERQDRRARHDDDKGDPSDPE